MRERRSRSRADGGQRVRLVLRLALDAEGVFGPGKAALLERIARLGSISAAARDMGMSYRQAWLLVQTMNQTFREPVVRASHGGQRGGGAVLTATGAELVRRYRDIRRKAEAQATREMQAIARLLAGSARRNRG